MGASLLAHCTVIILFPLARLSCQQCLNVCSCLFCIRVFLSPFLPTASGGFHHPFLSSFFFLLFSFKSLFKRCELYIDYDVQFVFGYSDFVFVQL